MTWLEDEPGARVYDVEWSGLAATLDVTTDDGAVPPIEDLQDALSTAHPELRRASWSMSVRGSSTSCSERMPRSAAERRAGAPRSWPRACRGAASGRRRVTDE